ncbi:hypothetical protein [Microvirga guangxiensis]|uniref:Membrane-anchored ribosome-binding protein, inhibits growth in stationary phase, ElaB/YqjD/DUF883 family n=1 Tax=Microvirga guangxiensis TaxID=549386 RepID=A0A1G5CP75_9HYPH|nr:hypothetical protein [Microvirga guangxiensis]SCY04196.1 Membrane-anchored ribosome-binding protein, inhibits growth in stationary phase, ElaB/YqjD/DUF883 family [Microvirga guangxiensis]
MANGKNESGNASGGKQNEAGSGKVSAGTSVGNIGEPPMPHAHDDKKGAQSATLASHTSHPMGGNQGSDKSKGSSQARSSQDEAGSVTDKAQQMAGDMRERAEDAYEGASEWARDTYERASEWASGAYEGQRRRVRRAGGRSAKAFDNARGGMQNYVSENPMVVGLVGLAAGLLLGALLPRTRRENEFFGEWADEVRNQGLRYARDAASRGREYVEETFSGDEAQFSRHESEFGSGSRDANRH